ncbi:hypothetical protein S245_042943 [Arachis hypogaea]
MGLTLLAGASMPTKFWGEAFTTAAKLINVLPTPVLHGQSPTEKLFGKKPPYGNLRVFGCLCFPRQRPFNKHKLDFRLSPCTFVGYGTTQKGYKCLTQQGKIITTPNVIFFEDRFPFEEAAKQGQMLVDPSSTPTISIMPIIPSANTDSGQQQQPNPDSTQQHQQSVATAQQHDTVLRQQAAQASEDVQQQQRSPVASSAAPMVPRIPLINIDRQQQLGSISDIIR